MSTDQRTAAPGRGRSTGVHAAGDAADAPPPAPAGKKKRLVLVLVVALVLAAAAAAYFLVLKPKGGEAAEPAHEEVVLGEVLTVEPVSLNLADGHYLRLGIALQLTAEVHEEVDTARAVDQAIALFSGRPVAEVSDPAIREQLKGELAHQLAETYHGEVVDVYLTEYVTQ